MNVPIEMIPDTPQQPAPMPLPNLFADYLPETADGLSESSEQSEPEFEATPADQGFAAVFEDSASKEEKREHKKKMSRKMKKTMERFQGMFTDGIANWFHQQSVVSGHPEWDLDNEEKGLIGDSIDFVMEAFNVEFDFETVQLKLTSIWWVFLYPVCAFGIVFLNKKSAVDQKVRNQDAA
jgi:hypothetical protein